MERGKRVSREDEGLPPPAGDAALTAVKQLPETKDRYVLRAAPFATPGPVLLKGKSIRSGVALPFSGLRVLPGTAAPAFYEQPRHSGRSPESKFLRRWEKTAPRVRRPEGAGTKRRYRETSRTC